MSDPGLPPNWLTWGVNDNDGSTKASVRPDWKTWLPMPLWLRDIGSGLRLVYACALVGLLSPYEVHEATGVHLRTARHAYLQLINEGLMGYYVEPGTGPFAPRILWPVAKATAGPPSAWRMLYLHRKIAAVPFLNPAQKWVRALVGSAPCVEDGICEGHQVLLASDGNVGRAHFVKACNRLYGAHLLSAAPRRGFSCDAYHEEIMVRRGSEVG